MTIAAADFGYVSALVRRHSAIVLEPGKEYLVEARLMPVAKRYGLADLGSLIATLRGERDLTLRTAVIEAMTTNETSWFRDLHPFRSLAEKVLPEIAQRRGSNRRLSIWSAACSSGQEPYTIAMVLADFLATHPGWSASILATDLSEEILARARAGRYSQLEVNRGLPAPLLVRHFDRQGTDWAVKDHLRRMVTFRQLNLAEPLPTLPQFDLVFLRNVLIYFDAGVKRHVLAQVRRVLAPDGYLVLGGAETTINIDDAFLRVPIGSSVAYRRKDGKANSS